MYKAVAAVLALWSVTTLADVDSELASGTLEIQRGWTLQQVHAAFPDGTVFPQENEEVAYSVAGDFSRIGLDLSVPLIQFVFTKQDGLQRVCCGTLCRLIKTRRSMASRRHWVRTTRSVTT